MPVQCFAGFEAGDMNELLVASGSVALNKTYARSGEYGCRIIPPSGPTAAFISLANGLDGNGAPSATARTSYTVGFAFRVLALPATPGAWEYLLYIASSSTHRASLRLCQDGRIGLHIGSSVAPQIAAFGPLTLSRWYYAEVVVLVDRYVWRMDGQVVAQGLGSPGGSMNAAYIGKRFSLGAQGYVMDTDDIYTADDLTLLGPTTRVVRLSANANGNAYSWMPYPPDEPPPEIVP